MGSCYSTGIFKLKCETAGIWDVLVGWAFNTRVQRVKGYESYRGINDYFDNNLTFQ